MVPNHGDLDARYLRAATQCELAATAIALRLYKQECGAPPTELSDLVPEYLQREPRDALRAGAPPIVWHRGTGGMDAFLPAGEAKGDPADPECVSARVAAG